MRTGILHSVRVGPSGSFGGAAGVPGLWHTRVCVLGPPALGVLQPRAGPGIWDPQTGPCGCCRGAWPARLGLQVISSPVMGAKMLMPLDRPRASLNRNPFPVGGASPGSSWGERGESSGPPVPTLPQQTPPGSWLEDLARGVTLPEFKSRLCHAPALDPCQRPKRCGPVSSSVMGGVVTVSG